MSKFNDRSSRQSSLQAEATRILREHGFTWAGKKKDDVDPDQAAFENRKVLVNNAGRGKSSR